MCFKFPERVHFKYSYHKKNLKCYMLTCLIYSFQYIQMKFSHCVSQIYTIIVEEILVIEELLLLNIVKEMTKNPERMEDRK